ncbi:MAG: hypothetical protein VKK59_03375 [Vampirovibrionales bacterium]|nr:hypothetical protein [Vampirovibrionales bacterium]
MAKRGQSHKAQKPKRASWVKQSASHAGGFAASCMRKRAYPTYGEATLAAEAVYQRGQVMVTIYDCPDCLQFHLTSKPWA